MPLSKYNRHFGGEEGSAAKAKAAMAKEYGSARGEGIFHALINKKKKAKREAARA